MNIVEHLRERWRRNWIITGGALLIICGILLWQTHVHAREVSRLHTESSQKLIDLIGKVESDDNYNAHFGNARNSRIRFTDMSIANVMEWQRQAIANGSPSSAVGRYQIIDTTLAGLVRELDLSLEHPFDEGTQDALATVLIERRGATEYANGQISREQFAANLAKEWAALPRIIGGDPAQSYYAGDGLNASRVAPHEVLGAIEPIRSIT